MTPIRSRKILLVGGAGFAGHALALRLKFLGAEVIVLDSLAVNNLHSHRERIGADPNAHLYVDMIQQRLELFERNGIPLVVLDARDYHALAVEIRRIDPEVLVHLAAVAHASVANKDPFSTFDHSLRTLENTLDISRSNKLKIRHFIYFSSSMVYGTFEEAAVDETTPCEPLGIYGALKFAGEKMVIAYHQVFGLPYTIVRPSALYGKRCVRRGIGQIFIENALRGEKIVVHGDGSSRLDFTYVEDLVEGVVKAIGNEASFGQIFNLTYGRGRPITDLVAVIQKHFPEVEVAHEPWDRLMPERGTLNVDKARHLLGYTPSWPIERGFEDYIRWYREEAVQRCPQRLSPPGRGA